MWTYSIYLEAVAIMPQLFMVSRTGEAETITSHYLFALGSYRALYILNWIYRYYTEDFLDLIVIVAGIVQTILYCDFFYLYITKGIVYIYINCYIYLVKIILYFNLFFLFSIERKTTVLTCLNLEEKKTSDQSVIVKQTICMIYIFHVSWILFLYINKLLTFMMLHVIVCH